ncbi:hypothetical protein OSB04_031956 [Centaurea solstitialis]|uniref:Integrase catalytic domain-containing protein n=1 Tax=Centaurea solstitialis TaxID=347529 RepID=A0AA38SI10_9ASTR|nr:hypothetical protein OSB04_031956 [Centaurea solstitialis]
MATFHSKDSYFDSGSLAKPPRFMPENFPLWKSRMELFLAGADPQIPYFIEHGPHVPTSIIPSVAATDNTPAVQERSFVKLVANWSDEDRRLVNIDTKAISLIAMSLPDEVFHSINKLKSAKEIWDTLCLQYEGADALMESRKIHLIRETLSQTHQRFNCLLIDLKTYDVSYSNSQVITKFMEALPYHWENYTMCLKMSKDIKTITLSELYGMMLNHEQHKTLKSNLIRDTKDVKSTSLALISDSPQPSNSISSPLQLLHMDLFGPINIQSIGGERYTLVIVDEYSRYTWVFFLRSKSDASQGIINFILQMEKYNQITVRSLRSDHVTGSIYQYQEHNT